MTLKAIVFDLDGVLTDTAELHYLAWKRLSDELSLDFNREYNEELKGVGRLDSFEIILSKNGKNDFYTLSEKESFANRKNEYYKELIATLTPSDILPGIGELLREIKAAGLKTAVASVSRNAPEVLKRLEIGHFFDTVADAGKVKHSKPDPEIFLTCARQLGVDPRECIGVEDSQAGIEAILAAKMYSVGINVTVTTKSPDLVLRSTSELNLDRLVKAFEAK